MTVKSKRLRRLEKLAMEKTNQEVQVEETQQVPLENPETVEQDVEETVTETTAAEVPVTEAVAVEEAPAQEEAVVTETVITQEPAVEVTETAEAPVPEVEEPVQEVVEVKPEVVEVKEPVKAEPATSTEAPRELTEEEQYLEKIRIEGTVEQKRMLAAIETFVQNLRPKTVIEPDKGVRYQYEFLQHLLWILEKDYDVFRAGWNVLLVYFGLHHGRSTPSEYTALSEYSTTRFLFAWNKGEERCNAYRNLITLLRATRNKDTRKHDIKTIMIDKIAPDVISQKAVDNLKKFYAV